MYISFISILIYSKFLYNIAMKNNNISNATTTNTDCITISRVQYEKFLALEAALKNTQNTNDMLQSRVNWLEQILGVLRQNNHGSKSEKISEELLERMGRLFDEPEVIKLSEEEEPEEEKQAVEVKAHIRTKKAKSNIWDKLPEGTATEVVEHFLPEAEQVCPNCGTEMEVIGKKEYKTMVIIPAQYKVRIDVCYTYACKSCPENGNNVTVIEAPRAKQVIPGSFASPEAIAHIMTQKYVMGSPLYRQEQEFRRQGLVLSRQTMANWLLASAEKLLMPLYECLHKKLLMQEILHADETTLQVLHEEGRKPQSQSYMWVYRTGSNVEHPIVLYKYEPGRSGKYPQEFLKGFEGYLHSDGYGVYHNLGSNVINVGCLVHARRKFHDVIKLNKKDGANQNAAKAVGYFTKIFKLEDSLAKKSVEERYQKRLELEKPILDELFAWAEKLAVTPKSKLGEAVTYLLNQKQYLYNYLLDGRLESSNNRAERSVKPFVISRKNFLFANTANGATGSGIIFSLIETAKENKLDPYRYLTYVLGLAPNLELEDDKEIEQLLPENVPENCKANYRGK